MDRLMSTGITRPCPNPLTTWVRMSSHSQGDNGTARVPNAASKNPVMMVARAPKRRTNQPPLT
ncbi:hypothetical protein GCM10010885_13320 [Alicyclobacillus cellulosilyticus]|uniref:Uncharacterized protein n=1 Tax=Alicyclobacillus cellulosilyticus TaxID=1003997 RepID=A0A917K978_9BACL|nr:hypothetical protein GCM10010885_13320 [Alicyclobacillus cellulosilyticus]